MIWGYPYFRKPPYNHDWWFMNSTTKLKHFSSCPIKWEINSRTLQLFKLAIETHPTSNALTKHVDLTGFPSYICSLDDSLQTSCFCSKYFLLAFRTQNIRGHQLSSPPSKRKRTIMKDGSYPTFKQAAVTNYPKGSDIFFLWVHWIIHWYSMIIIDDVPHSWPKNRTKSMGRHRNIAGPAASQPLEARWPALLHPDRW